MQTKPWTIQEDEILKSLLMLNILFSEFLLIFKSENPNKKWVEVSKLLFFKVGEAVYRSGKSCRERWNNYLCPYLKKFFSYNTKFSYFLRGDWSLEEDLKLFELVLKHGKKWAEISRIITGRTENGVKNRYNSMLKKWMRMKTNNPMTKLNKNIEKKILASLLQKKNCNQNKAYIPREKYSFIGRRYYNQDDRRLSLEELVKKNENNNMFLELKKSIILPKKSQIKREENEEIPIIKQENLIVEENPNNTINYHRSMMILPNSNPYFIFQNQILMAQQFAFNNWMSQQLQWNYRNNTPTNI